MQDGGINSGRQPKDEQHLIGQQADISNLLLMGQSMRPTVDMRTLNIVIN